MGIVPGATGFHTRISGCSLLGGGALDELATGSCTVLGAASADTDELAASSVAATALLAPIFELVAACPLDCPAEVVASADDVLVEATGLSSTDMAPGSRSCVSFILQTDSNELDEGSTKRALDGFQKMRHPPGTGHQW